MNAGGFLTDRAYSVYEGRLEKEIRDGPMPNHIAIIMDGNRRYAVASGKDIREGHIAGKDKIQDVLDWCLKLGVKSLTVYAFSTENFKREETEVSFLLELMEQSLIEMADDPRIHEYKVRLRVIGDRELIPESMAKAIATAEEKTASYDNYYFNMAIAYGGRQEIVSAVKEIATRVKNGELDVDDIDESMVSGHMYTSDLPDPDLILRTSGELRLSNFLLWQLAYSELYFADVYWPSFRYIDLLRAIRSFQQRARRYGK